MPRKKTITKKTQKKKTAKKAEKPKKEKKPKEVKKALKYFEGIGRRKTAVARVRIFPKGEKQFLVNEKSLDEHFPTFELKEIVLSPLNKTDCLNQFKISAKVRGGGISAQAEAVRHGLSRALVLFNPDFRKKLKKVGFLTRDSRMRERKKFGLKRARRAPQWQKR
jgi:small subunit ribosomal protein S9